MTKSLRAIVTAYPSVQAVPRLNGILYHHPGNTNRWEDQFGQISKEVTTIRIQFA